MEESRLTNISTLLANYSIGKFSHKLEVSDSLDEIDSIIMGINMLGEELEYTTISKNIFENIFNSVTNILFIVNKEGTIIGVNKFGEKIKSLGVKKIALSSICRINEVDDSFAHLSQNIGKQFEAEFTCKENQKIYTETSLVELSNFTKEKNNNYLVISEDISDKKKHHLQIVNTIINTQEIERKRVADDLHDSLGQELSSIRMMLSAINREEFSPINVEILENCTSILKKSITGLRSLCFNLMPSTLASSDLISALNELLENTLIKSKIYSNINTIFIEETEKLAIYRVCQEFLNNTIKYSEATEVSIDILLKGEKLNICIKDNGKGFDLKKIKKGGRGLHTMKSRIDSIRGYSKLESKINKGTQLQITIECKKQ